MIIRAYCVVVVVVCTSWLKFLQANSIHSPSSRIFARGHCKSILNKPYLSTYNRPTDFVHSYQMISYATSSSAPEWDAELGVWVGEKAAGEVHADDFPTPLYIFGYGSLIWRPGALLDPLPSYSCTALGYKRVFAQRSCDHRGTTKFPGLVLNLVSKELLLSRGYFPASSSSTEHDDAQLNQRSNENETTIVMEDDCHGLIWYIPKDKVVDVIEDLDFREKGGYHRHFIQVRLKEDTKYHKKDDIVQVLVYTGHESNPNFFLPTSPLRASHRSTRSNEDIFALQQRSIVTDIISTAIGPSGTNLEYLFRLQMYLESRGMADDYINNLSRAVRMRIGPWRKKAHYASHISQRKKHRISIGTHNRENIDDVRQLLNLIHGEYEIQCKLFGWGSNEYSQLCYRDIQANHDNLVEGQPEAIEPFAIDVAANIPTYVSSEWSSLQTVPRLPEGRSLHWNELEHHHVAAGGSASAYLWDHDKIRIWGKEIVNRLTEQHHLSRVNGSDNVSIVLEGVIGAAMGYNHILLLTKTHQVIAIGENGHQECDVPDSIAFGSYSLQCEYSPLLHIYSLQRPDENDTNKEAYKVVKLAGGLRHSAAITECGGLLTWGDGIHGQVLEQRQIWYPGEGRKLVDVCCGAKHTVVVDDHGEVYSFGSNRYGSLGRTWIFDENTSSESPKRKSAAYVDREVKKVEFPPNIRIQRVTCGWYHNVARGISPEGDLKFFAWGRHDMSQYIIADDEKTNDFLPTLLAPLPEGRTVAEAWCGSEFTVVVDNEDGYVWGCGWNEHGNLGIGPLQENESNTISRWVKMEKRSRLNEMSEHDYLKIQVWEGSLACGGGHILAISE